MANLSCSISAQGFSDAENGFKNTFKLIVNFFDSHNSYQRISSYVGLNGSSFPDSVGIWSFGVWRMVSASAPFDIFIGVVTASGTHNSTNGQFLINSTQGFGIMTAWHSSSVAWNGTTNNDGNDSFYSPWKSGSVILPTNNSIQRSSGSSEKDDAPNKNRCTTIFGTDVAIAQPSLRFIADDDNFYIGETEDSGIAKKFVSFQKYEPAQTSFDLPYFMASSQMGQVVPYSVLDTMLFGHNGESGGLLVKKNTNADLSASYDFSTVSPTYIANAITLSSASNFTFRGPNRTQTEWPYLIFKGAGYVQYVGYSTFMRVCPGLQPGSIFGTTGSQRIIHGATNDGFVSASFPWISAAGTYNTVHTSASYFRTGSYFAAHHLSASDLFPSSSTSGRRILYRYFSAGNYFYTNSPTGLETSLTVILENDQST